MWSEDLISTDFNCMIERRLGQVEHRGDMTESVCD